MWARLVVLGWSAWVGVALVGCGELVAGEDVLDQAKPVPRVQALPLPEDQASFEYEGRELTRYYFGPALRRPFCYPMAGPEGRSLTRMGHPRDPNMHCHHNSVWIAHQNVGGVDFWPDHGKNLGRIVHQRIEQYEDGDRSAWLLAVNHWEDATGRVVMVERRRIEVEPISDSEWWMFVDLQLESPGAEPVILGQTPFGMIGARMAKTIGVNDGGGRILNSDGGRNEAEVFRKPARWVDYSGPVTNRSRGGIALMDHPRNAGHPSPFHVRDDGWMGVCLTLDGPRTIEPERPLRLRYGLWVHAGVPDRPAVDARWESFRRSEPPPMHRTTAR